MEPRRFAHYEVLEKLGEGGMGIVWKARDPRLNRLVAVKVLQAGMARDEVRRARFAQEARSASALNHPNIITIHDIGRDDDRDFIVMEFVDGVALADLIAKGPMKPGEVLKYGVQIADALASAHKAGIVHRDLKPMNIMVTRSGLVKVLDFGLAKLTESEAIDQDDSTIPMPRTDEGTIVGTIAYMSPEQAEGRKVDQRSDVFSFGSILYEMVSGHRAFSGSSRVSTLSAIINSDPKSISELIPPSMRELDRVIRRCLRKDPSLRYQHMDDLKISLQDLKEDSESEISPVYAPGSRTPRRVGWFVVAGALAAVGIGGWLSLRKPVPITEQPAAVRQLTFDAGLTTDPAYWPSGNMIAYASDRATANNLDIWIQQIGGEARQLTQDPADDSQPDFSPDGTNIVFRSERDGGGLYVIPTLGGRERKLTSTGYDPRFSPDGKWICYWVGDVSRQFGLGKTFIIPAEGGAPIEIAPKLQGAARAAWSPDGRRIAFLSTGHRRIPFTSTDDVQTKISLFVQPVPTGEPEMTDLLRGSLMEYRNRYRFTWLANELLYSAPVGDAVNIWRLPIDSETLDARGPAQRLTAGTSLETSGILAGRNLIYSSVVQNVDIWSVPIDSATSKSRGDPIRITTDLSADIGASVSADGERIAWFEVRSQEADLMVQDVKSGQRSKLITVPRGNPLAADLANRGDRVSYTVTRGNPVGDGFVIPAGGGAPEKVCSDCVLRSWSDGDDSGLLLTRLKPSVGTYLLDLRSRQERRISDAAAPARALRDGKFWCAYQPQISQGPGPRIYLIPVYPDRVATLQDAIAITAGAVNDYLNAPSPDGNTIFFASSRDGFHCLWGQKLNRESKGPEGSPFPVYHQHSARRSTLFIGSGQRRLAAARDKLVFPSAERTGNIWMAEVPNPVTK